MKAINEFYERLKDYEQNETWTYKFLQYMMQVFYILFNMVTADQQIIKESPQMVCFAILFLVWAVHSYLVPLTMVSEKRRSMVSILKTLRYIPLNRKQLIRMRSKKMVSYLIKLIGVGLLMSCVTACLFCGGISWWNILYPLGTGMMGLLFGYAMSYL